MNVFRSNRRALLLIGIGALLGAVALFFFAPQLIGYFLAAVLLAGAVWIGAHYAVRLTQRRKQRRFDAGVAAREGIEDRKREWSTWTAELDQRGIDRYDLPFFLLVGEPQSGKSVLLQNSDLNFPFGQTRLSGIGGTRGCDWWFTEEAVILDLAGRLFTHEGGASDEAEWESFLGLLASYRPMCPANGLMLVIPCDSLLSDSRDQSIHKASKIQNALLTLTNKLQAQLPIYVVLTKADRIFGFAETVHRLEPEQRQQMFGWSRPAEDFEAPFDMVEVRQAFQESVNRARALRESMIATVRLPEGIGEVDRMYAFPDEFGAILPALEIYLKRIFSESNLIDRLHFRGFYLTSGLQTGAPIANVCSELFGGAGEADRRDLSALFTKQHAYFIKDFVRRRVFSERGLVRPTQQRVARAKRNAWLSYGLASALALVSLAWSTIYVLGEYQQSDLDRFERAIQQSAEVANTDSPTFEAVLGALDAVWRAQQVAPRSLEGSGVSRAQSFEQLYVSMFDTEFAPALRRKAEQALAALAATEPADHADFRHRAAQTTLLLGGFVPGEETSWTTLADLFDTGLRERIKPLLDHRVSFADGETLPRSERAGGSTAPLTPELATAARWVDAAWPHVLEGGHPLQPAGAAGYVVAWREVREAYDGLDATAADKVDGPAFGRLCASYHRSATYLRSTTATADLTPAGEGWLLARRDVDAQLSALESAHDGYLVARGDAATGDWSELIELRSFVTRIFGGDSGIPGGAGEAVAAVQGPRTPVPTEQLAARLAPALVAATDTATLAGADAARPKGLPDRIRRALTAAGAGDDLALRVIRAKCHLLQSTYLEEHGSWDQLVATFAGGADAPVRTALVPALEHLTTMADVIGEIDPAQPAWLESWSQATDASLQAALEAGRALVGDWSPTTPSAVDPALLRALRSVAVRGGPVDPAANALIATHVTATQDQLTSNWATEEPDSVTTSAMLRALRTHLDTVVAATSAEDATDLTATWLEEEVRVELRRRVQSHETLLREASPIPSAATDLAGAANGILELLSPAKLLDWQGALTNEWKALDAANIQPTLDALADWELMAKEIGDIDRLSRRETKLSRYVLSSERVKLLKESAESIRGLPADRRGESLAAALATLRKRRPATAPGSAADWMLDRLIESLDGKSVELLRTLYLADLRKEFEFRASLRPALYPGQLELPRLVDDAARIGSDLDEFLAPDGKLDELREDYLIDANFEFRPEEATEPAWRFDRFLSDLQQLMAPGTDARTLHEEPLEVRVEAKDLTRGVWAYNYLFTNVEPSDDNYVNTDLLTTLGQIGPLKWRFGAEGDTELWFRWTKSVSEEQPDDRALRIGSCFAPLLLVWEYGKPDGSSTAADTWNVAAPTRGSGDMTATFRVRFDRPVPSRPARPWSD